MTVPQTELNRTGRIEGRESEWKGSGTAMGRIGIAAFTERGKRLAQRISELLSGEYDISMYGSGLKQWCREQFETHSEGLIFVGASGIAVRTIAPYLKSKTTDPAVLVIDEAGRYVISLLSGHIGGANRLALLVAGLIGAEPVITTATDVNGKFAVDVFAKDNQLSIGSMKAAKEISAAILRGEPVGLYCEKKISGEVPPELIILPERRMPDVSEEAFKTEQKNTVLNGWKGHLICISCDTLPYPYPDASGNEKNHGQDKPQASVTYLHLRPKPFILGIGCRKGKTEEEIEEEIRKVLDEEKILLEEVAGAASIDLKKEEPGLKAFCRKYGLRFETYSAETLLGVEGEFSSSGFVRRTTGVDNVCERSSLCMAGKGGQLVRKKYANNGVTVAVAARDWSVHFEK